MDRNEGSLCSKGRPQRACRAARISSCLSLGACRGVIEPGGEEGAGPGLQARAVAEGDGAGLLLMQRRVFLSNRMERGEG